MTEATVPTPDEPNPDAAPTAPAAVGRALFTPPFTPQEIRLPLVVHVDTESMWAEIPGMPGLFATGVTPTELGTSLGAAVEAYLTESVSATLTPEQIDRVTAETENPEASDQP